tara:strand:+ start:12452 stop:12979 length:528 start_codon:yes stop_codon:yes gene_type:complete
MRIIETKAYQFEELDEQTKEKAIDNCRYISVDDGFWHEFIKEDLNSIGIELIGFDIDRGSFAEIHIDDMYISCEKIIESHGGNCEKYKIAERYIEEYNSIKDKMDNLECYENEYSDELMQLDNDLEDLDEEYQKEFSEEVLSMLRREFEYMTSDEHVFEFFDINQSEFTAEGEII